MATLPIKRGNDEPQLQYEQQSWQAGSGGTTRQFWRGLSVPKMVAKYQGVVFTTTRADLKNQFDVSELTLEWSGASGSGGGATNTIAITTDRWECPEPKINKPLTNHPAMYAAFYTLSSFMPGGPSDAFVANIAAQFKKGYSQQLPPADQTVGSTLVKGWLNETNFPGWNSFILSNPTMQGLIIRNYLKCVNDQTEYQTCQYALRHITNAPNYWSRNVADNNTNRIYTTNQLLAECNDASLWYLPLPGRLNYKISAAVADLLATTPYRANHQIGWLKSASGEATTGGGRIEIQTGFVLDQWSTDIYALAV